METKSYDPESPCPWAWRMPFPWVGPWTGLAACRCRPRGKLAGRWVVTQSRAGFLSGAGGWQGPLRWQEPGPGCSWVPLFCLCACVARAMKIFQVTCCYVVTDCDSQSLGSCEGLGFSSALGFPIALSAAAVTSKDLGYSLNSTVTKLTLSADRANVSRVVKRFKCRHPCLRPKAPIRCLTSGTYIHAWGLVLGTVLGKEFFLHNNKNFAAVCQLLKKKKPIF